MAKLAYDIIIKPVITEKSMEMLAQHGKYTFKVAKDSNKIEIAKAVEEIFGVSVVKVNTLNVKPKPKRQRYQLGKTRTWKKAVVRLTKDSKAIEFFEGMV